MSSVASFPDDQLSNADIAPFPPSAPPHLDPMSKPPIRARQSTGSRTKESRAFVSLFRSFELKPPVKTIADLSSGKAFADVLALV